MSQLSLSLPTSDFIDAHNLKVVIDPRVTRVFDHANYVGHEAHTKRFNIDAKLVHVMSPHRGGEIRGYWLIDGRLHVRLPDHAGAWRELDDAVAARLGATVVAYIADEGGVRGAA